MVERACSEKGSAVLKKHSRNIYISLDIFISHMIQNNSRWLVLKQFMDDPMKGFLVREMGRSIKLAPISVKAHIKSLEKEGLVKETKGLYRQYSANFDNEEFRFYKIINSLITIRESGLIRFLEQKIAPEAIILFGSASKGEDLAGSDIDLFLEAEAEEIDLAPYEKKLGKKIQLFMHKDINKVPKELRNNIINGIKIGGYITLWR